MFSGPTRLSIQNASQSVQPFSHSSQQSPYTLQCALKCDERAIKKIKSSAAAEMGDRLATIDMGRKVQAAVILSVGGAGSQSIAMLPGPRPTSIPSGSLIHPTIWPQYTNVTDRQTGQWSRSIGRTVTYSSRPKN